ncbi:MAG: DUF116 domain-containing protein [Candidatus Nanoarchaeia archaeon]|nr:DUF116 domain-containing protein [Candidatus Haiyanarchaeum thermophilum]MCW1303044.1 DUF116 domain-containing protein [Candidatus Haiyanarchaeum thermophilum]MCW1304137.1 DUF116 domain-containing protein [Candidatus Haiyanarchaeum thermophilum]MCW1306846.1 DUF116 domain-containing protein [Candidatus Haiyanarchaeum thermophilum]MCW1307088.1 DUF116 domain-containing protein [Candidatus Haiyanarchaeum thermophilum]
MPYQFNFDLSKLPSKILKKFYNSIMQKGLHHRSKEIALKLARKLKLDEILEIQLEDAAQLIVDLMDIAYLNSYYKRNFAQSDRRALLLPHCARKYMDNRCKAKFDENIPTYYCSHCSEDCLVNQGSSLGVKYGYDIYVIPGSACVKKILQSGAYNGVVGVACPMEIKLAGETLRNLNNVAGQAVILTKNGCSNTSFDLRELERVLALKSD